MVGEFFIIKTCNAKPSALPATPALPLLPQASGETTVAGERDNLVHCASVCILDGAGRREAGWGDVHQWHYFKLFITVRNVWSGNLLVFEGEVENIGSVIRTSSCNYLSEED